MPFINGRFYINPAYGHAVEAARAAEAASQRHETDQQEPGAHWVTIDGRHVLIHETQAGRAQHQAHAQHAPLPPLGPIERQQGAVVYSEKTTATPAEARAIVSVIQNRVRSNDRQYVQHGQSVTTQNVIHNPHAFGGVNGHNYQDFMAGRATGPGAQSAAQAVRDVQEHGVTTDATFFIVKPRGERPTHQQQRHLGDVEPANPSQIGNVYLYRPRQNPRRR